MEGREDEATSGGEHRVALRGGEEKTGSGCDGTGLTASFLRMMMRMRGEGGFIAVVKWVELLVAMVVGSFW